MAKLAIRGHATRGKEVIEILEILGGINDKHCCGGFINRIYFINKNGYIESCDRTDYFDFPLSLEEFLEKYPYIVGDKVIYHDCVAVVTAMEWVNNEVCYTVLHKGVKWQTTVFYLQPYKETMEENPDKALASDLIRQDYSGKIFGYKIPNGYEFDCVKNNEIILKLKQHEYPTTYEECCKVLGYDDRETYCVCHTGANERLFENLYRLKVCRDAYWKIAGEQLGLDKPWEPDWTNHEFKYCIKVLGNTLECVSEMNIQCTLSFPTAEMRDAFKGNFDDDIKFCKEFL